MTTGRNRYGRQDHRVHERATGERLSRRLRWAVLAAALASLVIGAVPAQAGTGGASATTTEATPATGGIVFSSMRIAGATWYGPGLYGQQTACGETLEPETIGVAHRTLPCGATVKLTYHGHTLVTQVIDRGPYTPGNAFDLTNGARQALEFNGSARLHYAVAVQYARQP
jgi:rare lipoprotein A (peptidoglycan hydrolase)